MRANENWLYGILLTIALSAPSLPAKLDVKTDNVIRATYVPLSKHADCKTSCDKFTDMPDGLILNVQQICGWSDLPALSASGNAGIIFVMCPATAEKFFNRDNFRMTDALRADMHKLVSETKAAVDLGVAKESKPMQISEKLQKIINTRLKIIQRYAQDPLVVNSVKKANAKDVTLDKIKELDSQWINKTEADHADEILSNNISKFLRKKILSNKLLYTEAFLCDVQGATVGTYPRTSDYWQGDETKFTKCFNNQETFIGPLEFDESTNSYAVQVSMPVKDSGKTIGVLVVGLRNIK